jgi:AraC-like DNA-binding protein
MLHGSVSSREPIPTDGATIVRLDSHAGFAAHAQPVPRRRSRAPLPNWRLRRVEAYVDANIEETVTLADLARVAGLSPMHFAAQFRAATGIRPHEFLLRRRIDHAQAMLADPRAKLVDVALSVGFQTQAHFTTVFKRFVGETPHRWRYAETRFADNATAVSLRRVA